LAVQNCLGTNALRFQLFKNLRFLRLFIGLCLLSVAVSDVLNESADGATKKRYKASHSQSQAPSSQSSETVLRLSSPYSENLNSAGISAGIRLLSPGSKTVQLQPGPRNIFGWMPQQGSGERFLQKMAPPPSMSARPKLAEPLFLDATLALQDGDYPAARSKVQDALKYSKTAAEAFALGKELTSLELYGLAQSAFVQAEIQDDSLKEPIAEWQRMYFPSKLLSSEKEALFVAALYDSHKTPDEQLALLEQLSKQMPEFSPVWRHMGLLQIKAAMLSAPSTLLPASQFKTTEGLKNLKRASSLSPGSYAELEAWGDGAALAENFSLAIEVYTLAQANLPQKSESNLWGTLEGKKKQALGSLSIQKSGPSSAAYRTLADGLQLQNRPIEYFQALYEAKNIENKGIKF
jgi:hypothetical protein